MPVHDTLKQQLSNRLFLLSAVVTRVPIIVLKCIKIGKIRLKKFNVETYIQRQIFYNNEHDITCIVTNVTYVLNKL